MTETSFTSYPKSYNVGHAALRGDVDILKMQCRVEEKVDGSQFSFGLIDGKVMVRSRGSVFDVNAPDDMFKPACATVLRLYEEGKLVEGWTYRGETLKSPRHNTLRYGRVPKGNIILFDVSPGNNDYLAAHAVALALGLESVPCLHVGPVTIELLDKLLETESVLGGVKIEGVVCKPITPVYGRDGKPIFAKYVAQSFKELHSREWKKQHPSKNDIRDQLVERYRSEARFAKAVQRVRDDGGFVGGPEAIGPLIKNLSADTLSEIELDAKDRLWNHFKKDVVRGVTRGFAEWFKAELAKEAQP